MSGLITVKLFQKDGTASDVQNIYNTEEEATDAAEALMLEHGWKYMYAHLLGPHIPSYIKIEHPHTKKTKAEVTEEAKQALKEMELPDEQV